MNYVTLYIFNSRELYCKLEWLANCVAKKVAKGEFISSGHLENCSSVRSLIASGSKKVREMEDYTPGKEERAEAKVLIRRKIIEDFLPFLLEDFGKSREEAQELINNYVTI